MQVPLNYTMHQACCTIVGQTMADHVHTSLMSELRARK